MNGLAAKNGGLVLGTNDCHIYQKGTVWGAVSSGVCVILIFSRRFHILYY